MKPNDMHAAHHIIPEEVMKKYPAMFNRAKTFGFNPDGPSNGIELPRVKALAEAVGLPGHWSSHIEYSALVESDVAKLNSAFRSGRISDIDLALGIKSIQNKWRSNINSEKVPTNKSGRLC